ncbi:MAG: DUF748 domain-containing protein [Deltaproteobacteria bacterium]|nr:DUF748 domain-containing protein [Deltaproteobacteria bacterium]
MRARAEAWVTRAFHLGRTSRLRVTAVIIVAALAVFTLAGFFGVPLLLEHMAQGTAAAILHRRVTVGMIRFNPYTLQLSADTLRVSERDSDEDFATVGQIRLKASWSSLYRLAPIIQELTIYAPAVNIVRYHSHKFNFADLLEIQLPHFRFSVSNIRLNDGQVHFEDRPFNEHHTVDQVQIGVPFIGNLPAETTISVQPSLRMVIDRSPFQLMGEALPFRSTPESILKVKIKALDLRRIAPYLEHLVPINLLGGSLSTKLQLHFMRPASGPVLKIGGTIDMKNVEVRDASNAPLVSFKTASMTLTDVDPMLRTVILGDIEVDGLATHLVRLRGGSTNLTPLAASSAAKKPASVKNPGAEDREGTSFHAFVHSFDLTNSELDLEDETTATPISLALKGVHIGVRNFAYDEQAPAFPFEAQAHLGDGSLGLTGNLDLAHSHVALEATLHKIDLRPVQGLAQRFWSGTLSAGQLSAKAQIQTDFAPDKFDVVVQPADLFLETLELHAPGDAQKPVKLKTLKVAVDRFDLNAHRAAVKEVDLDGLSLSVRRSPDGSVSLDGFLRAGEPQFSAPTVPATKSTGRSTKGSGASIEAQNQPLTTTPTVASKPAPVWQYQIASVAAQNIETEVEDDSTAKPIILNAAPLSVHLKDVSSDLSKPIGLNIDATLKPYGAIKIDGTVDIDQFAAKLHVATTRLDLSPARAYLSRRLNANLTAAALAVDGDLEAVRGRENFALSYRGNFETEVEVPSTSQPIILNAAPLDVHLEDLSNGLSKPIGLNIDATLRPYGAIKIAGNVSIEPLAAKLHVVTTRVDLSPAATYLSGHLKAKLARALLTVDGELETVRKLDNFSLSYRGDAILGNLLLIDKLTNEQFLRCGALIASGIDANFGAGVPRVAVGEVGLANFYARVVLNSNAKLNLGDLTTAPDGAASSISQANLGGGYAEVPTATQQTLTEPPVKPPIDADIRVGGVTLEGGAINYTDNFIQPHYTVDLTNIAGKIGGFSTSLTIPAEVEVRGLINSVSPIEISGSINPLAPKAFVDIKAKADGYQLINLTAYSAKYTGYPITMGTLKVDVHYLVRNRQLTATNHLFISRLSLGDKVQSASAIDLPIALAVKLLKNPRGEIDITVPLSGSLDDPQFSLGGLVLHGVKDLILKIVESPFELLASVAGAESGSGQNLGHVQFPAGLATLTPTAKSQLLTVAKAMQSRPELRLTLTPRVDPSTDRPGLRAVLVDRLVKMQKVEEIKAQGQTANVASLELTPDEYNHYLTLVYQQAQFPKPGNFLGHANSLPPDEMKKVLAEKMKVTDDDLKTLAIARVIAIGDYLDQRIDPVRLAVVPPNIGVSGTHQAGGVDLTVD